MGLCSLAILTCFGLIAEIGIRESGKLDTVKISHAKIVFHFFALFRINDNTSLWSWASQVGVGLFLTKWGNCLLSRGSMLKQKYFKKNFSVLF